MARSAHRQAHCDRRNRARQAHPDRDRRLAVARQGHRGPRARHLVERGVSPQGVAEAHPDPGRRLYRARVRQHLQRARLRGDAWSIAAKTSCAASTTTCAIICAPNWKSAASRSSPGKIVEGDREGRSRPLRAAVRSRGRRGRQGDVRDRPPSQCRRASGSKPPASSSTRRARSRSTSSRRPSCRTSMRSATSPTASL